MADNPMQKLKLARFAVGVPILAALLLAISVGGRARAQATGKYEVNPQAGPWMVCVTSYTGPAAVELAETLVIELRERYQLPAYTYNRGAEERRKQQESLDARRQQQQEFMKSIGLKTDQPIRLKRVRIQEQCAVLVGGYEDIEEAREAMEKIKKLNEPKSETNWTWISSKGDDKHKATGQRSRNPFPTAFVVHNPTVPIEKPEVDHAQDFKFLERLNSGERYSLLECRKPWTLAVKEFQGRTVVQPKSAPTGFIKKLFGGNVGQTLDAGAQQAHELAKVMREKMNMEAYVLHTRRGSVLTVGGYDSPNDPRMQQNKRMLANLQFGPAIRFLAVPLPMKVPKD